MSSGKEALVLLVHGSRDPAWMGPFEQLREELEKNASAKEVRIACLQFCSPDLLEVVSGLSEEGVGTVLIVPVFISGKGHVLKDVPAAVKASSERYPGMDIRVTEALGEFPEVARTFRDALLGLLRE